MSIADIRRISCDPVELAVAMRREPFEEIATRNFPPCSLLSLFSLIGEEFDADGLGGVLCQVRQDVAVAARRLKQKWASLGHPLAHELGNRGRRVVAAAQLVIAGSCLRYETCHATHCVRTH